MMFRESLGPFDPFSTENLDAETLACLLAELNDDELAKLEDELDFCMFTGVASLRILKILREMTDLDDGWRAQLRAESTPEVPEADILVQRRSIKRGDRNTGAFQSVAYCA